MIDESPDIFNSIHYRKLIGKSLWQQFDFKNPKQVSDNLFSWDTKFGVKVYGTEKEPFRQRAKIHDDNQNIKYHSLLMKMTLTQKFIEQIYDTYGVEFIVDNDKEIRKLMSLFNLEKYEHIEKTEPPRFFCDKFIVRVPVRVDSSIQSNSQEKWATLRRPIEKYIRIPVEMQIRPIKTLSKTDHELYKKQQFQNVFPIWYPDSIYTPLIVKSIDK